MKIPQKGLDKDALLARLEEYRAGDMPWRDGRTWAYIYDPGKEAEQVIKTAYMMYLSENALDPTVFPSTLRLENDVIAMAAAHLGGDQNVVGNFTSGGTESILCAVKAARDYHREHSPQIQQPEIVLPATAHAAFQKACHYLCVKPVIVGVNEETWRADPKKVEKAIGPNTIMIVGSAISYAHGVVDPIGELGEIAQKHDLLLHVDGCMGGFLLPYFRRLGRDVPAFDFSVPGVTSISMDLHKYAFAAKGASTILYRSKNLRKHQMYACANWTGYTVINATVQSTKSAGPLAAAWAVLSYFGDEGYLEIARQVLGATERIADGIEKIPELRLLGRPDMNLLAFTSDSVSVFHMIDDLKSRGWYVQPQLAYGNSKENIHLSINPASVHWVEDLLKDIRASVEVAKGMKSGELAGSLGPMLEGMDGAQMSDDMFHQMLGMAGLQGFELPERMAEINEILNALPVAMREKLLVAFLNELYKQ